MGFPIIFTSSVSSNGTSVTDKIIELVAVSRSRFQLCSCQGKNLLDDCPLMSKIVIPVVVWSQD